jgi:hypothetical protein
MFLFLARGVGMGGGGVAPTFIAGNTLVWRARDPGHVWRGGDR